MMIFIQCEFYISSGGWEGKTFHLGNAPNFCSTAHGHPRTGHCCSEALCKVLSWFFTGVRGTHIFCVWVDCLFLVATLTAPG
jgi:hypothetical protein